MGATFMVGVAFFVDLTQGFFTFVFVLLGFIPAIGLIFGVVGVLLNTLISIVTLIAFWLWFKLLTGESFARGATFFGGALGEFIPLINTFPIWTVSVMLTILIVKREDARYNKSTANGIVARTKAQSQAVAV